MGILILIFARSLRKRKQTVAIAFADEKQTKDDFGGRKFSFSEREVMFNKVENSISKKWNCNFRK